MQSYVFPVVVEPDDEKSRAYVPGLEHKGAATWGQTREEVKNILATTRPVGNFGAGDGKEAFFYA